MCVRGLSFRVRLEVMSGFAQRIRYAVSRISAVEQYSLSSLPVLERSLVPVLSVASTFYTFGILVRQLLYQLGIFGRTRLPIPVISVGNVTWGGTGKTPMVEYLARHYLAACVSPLILSRGYRGGDEVHLLQKHLQDTPTRFGVGSNRTKVALSILRHEAEQRSNGLASIIGWKAEIGVAILDDGMQHWALERDLEIVMINSLTLWGNERLVPRGPMRESLEAIERAHVVVLHHANLVLDDQLKSIRETIDPFLRKGSIVLSSHMRPLCIYRYTKSSYLPSELPLLEVKGAVTLCVSAVGCPESLDLILLQVGASHVERLDFVDHHKFKNEDLKGIAEVFKQLQLRFPHQRVMLVTTEKDYMRDPAVMIELGNLGEGIFVLHSALEIVGCHGNDQSFRELLGSVYRQQNSKRMRLTS
ncbi:probable tetraacyldisaccharide 4'-kinase, mitochondrial isoform X1 [Physcomitrium patens]|uniref:tetraacyldisaccharide 4'-kinase n=2 Tax=Physcomitrium patens TaxID=3218 RepID=A0A7I4F9S1_PHYPA|nr:probable tetraacyldisaccharide 4'-kinase, mitochondrial isoform X1 [Physcomitrium patens]|eukprot:XP_024403907.1 probable tetraacyldisaccharide 4'-kinase, mitochondrial isoform X1 [Physcomitrella patens]